MKKNTGNNIRLGLFVITSLVLFMVGVYYIGQRQHLFSNTFKINAVFKDIGGLQEGNNVRFSGINVGVVDNIVQITDSTVKVEMRIEEETRKFIKKDARARIGSDGLMGNKIITISPGSGDKPVINEGGYLKTVVPVTVDDVLSQLKLTSENSAKITSDLAAITGNIRDGKGTIGMLFMDTAFAETIRGAMFNIKAGAGGFKRNMDAASKSIFLRGKFKRKKDQK
ncbi:MAG TPA: MlaD family protein [Flavobacteriales bacterium]|nr:MlaD family protein [Flavobacteriales bacterium]